MGDSISSRHEFISWPLAQTANDLPDHADIFYARRYGAECSDLDIDERSGRTTRITKLLKTCLRNIQDECYSEAEILSWSFKHRLQALLAIAVATHGGKMELQVICADSACAQVSVLALDLLEFYEREDSSAIICRPSEDSVLELRLPTSADQKLWLNQKYNANNDSLFSKMATDLVISVNGVAPSMDWQMPPAWLNSIAQSLESHDAMMTMSVDSQCPACGSRISIELDLEAQLLSLFANEKRILLKHVHQLASAYHWSEKEIISLPKDRRLYYIGRLEEDAFA